MVQREPWRIHERWGHKQSNEDMNLKNILGILLEHMIKKFSKNILYEESLRFPGGRCQKYVEFILIWTSFP